MAHDKLEYIEVGTMDVCRRLCGMTTPIRPHAGQLVVQDKVIVEMVKAVNWYNCDAIQL